MILGTCHNIFPCFAMSHLQFKNQVNKKIQAWAASNSSYFKNLLYAHATRQRNMVEGCSHTRRLKPSKSWSSNK
jgi:hypothetical protein